MTIAAEPTSEDPVGGPVVSTPDVASGSAPVRRWPPTLSAVAGLAIIGPALMAVFLALFYALNVEIDATHLSFRFGIGLIRQRIPLADIVEAKPAMRVSPVMACLVDVYGAELGRGTSAEIDPLLMMRPPRGC